MEQFSVHLCMVRGKFVRNYEGLSSGAVFRQSVGWNSSIFPHRTVLPSRKAEWTILPSLT